AGGVWPALNWSIRGYRVRTRIAFVSVSREVDRHERLAARNNNVRNTVWRAVVDAAEVGMQRGGCSNAGYQVVGVGIDRCVRYIEVPGIVGGKHLLAMET